MTLKQSLSPSDLRFLRSVCARMAERVAPQDMDKVRVRDVLARQELQNLRAGAVTGKSSTVPDDPAARPTRRQPRRSRKPAPDVA